MIVWHYTPSYRARGILVDGAISTATERPFPGTSGLIWFSANERGEPTATTHSKAMALLTRELFMVRFGIPAEIATQYRAVKIPLATRRQLDRTARKRGAIPGFWYCMKGPVPLSAVARIEWDRPGFWEPVTADTLLGVMRDWPILVAGGA